jgi:ribosomal protein L20
MAEHKYCRNCGKQNPPDKYIYCCTECRKEAALSRTISGRKKRAKRKAHALAEINAAARSEGLTYGQYVAKYGSRKDDCHAN